MGRRGALNVNSKLSANETREIRQRARSGESGRSLARAFEVSHTTIRRILLRITWKHVT